MSEAKKTIAFPGVDLANLIETPMVPSEAALELLDCAGGMQNDRMGDWILLSTEKGSAGVSISLSKVFQGNPLMLQAAMGKLEMAKQVLVDVLRMMERGVQEGPTLDRGTEDERR